MARRPVLTPRPLVLAIAAGSESTSQNAAVSGFECDRRRDYFSVGARQSDAIALRFENLYPSSGRSGSRRGRGKYPASSNAPSISRRRSTDGKLSSVSPADRAGISFLSERGFSLLQSAFDSACADVPVLLSAIASKPDWLLTHNTKHFTNAVAQRTGLRIATPADFFRILAALAL
jgi:hypothetical protein